MSKDYHRPNSNYTQSKVYKRVISKVTFTISSVILSSCISTSSINSSSTASTSSIDNKLLPVATEERTNLPAPKKDNDDMFTYPLYGIREEEIATPRPLMSYAMFIPADKDKYKQLELTNYTLRPKRDRNYK